MIEGRHYAARQSQGARNYQEDEFGFLPLSGDADDRPHDLVAVLADGMGGHKGGAHASAAAVAAFIKTYEDSDLPTPERLRHALDSANAQIGADSHGNPELEGMGCTLVGAAFTEGGLQWISVGDSPFWLFRGDRLIRLNADHSMAPLLAEQVAAGKMSAEEAAHHPQRNALRSAVIGDTLPLIDLKDPPMPLEPGDRLVLSSDGLETLSDDEIAEVLREGAADGPESLAERLLAAVEARNRKGQDNTTVIIVEPFGAGAGAKAAPVDTPTIIPARVRKARAGRRGVGIAVGVVALLIAAGVAAAWKLGLPPFGRGEPKPPVSETREGGRAGKPAPLDSPATGEREGTLPGATGAPTPGEGKAQPSPAGEDPGGGEQDREPSREPR